MTLTLFDFKGKSIFYLPFSHASPLVERKAGFISNISTKSIFWISTELPFYYPLNNYEDITIKPRFSQKKTPSLFIEHRKNFNNGEIESVHGMNRKNIKDTGATSKKKRSYKI